MSGFVTVVVDDGSTNDDWTVTNERGTYTLRVAPGRHVVTFIYGDTKVRKTVVVREGATVPLSPRLEVVYEIGCRFGPVPTIDTYSTEQRTTISIEWHNLPGW